MLTSRRFLRFGRLASVGCIAVVALLPESAFCWGCNETFENGHHFIVRKAAQYLQDRDLWNPGSVSQDEAAALLQYGVAWADHPWNGRPEAIHGFVFGVRDYWDSTAQYRFIGTDSESHTGSYLAIDTSAAVEWQGHTLFEPNWYMDATFTGTFTFDWDVCFAAAMLTYGEALTAAAFCEEFADFEEQQVVFKFAVDNLYHYSFDDIVNAVILYPFSMDALPDSEEEKLAGMQLYGQTNIGTDSYGAILYQLARKFVEGSWAEPSLHELPFASYYTAPSGFRTGRVHPDRPDYDQIDVRLPTTYLGGMPFTCSSGAPDSCSSGLPTWPIWVPANYDGSSYASRVAFLSQLQNDSPGRSTRVALIYLGWAAHFIQDAAVPHHALGWTGFEHEAIEEQGGDLDSAEHVVACHEGDSIAWGGYCGAERYQPRLVDVDEYYRRGLDDVFGTEISPRSRAEICAAAGIYDSQIDDGTLNWEAVSPVFQQTVARSRQALDVGKDAAGAEPWIRDAIHDTMLLLACFRPLGLHPAQIMAATGVLL